MKLSFWNMPHDANIFSIPRQPNLQQEDDIHEVSLIDSIVEDHFNLTQYGNPIGSCLTHLLDNLNAYSS